MKWMIKLMVYLVHALLSRDYTLNFQIADDTCALASHKLHVLSVFHFMITRA